MNRCTTVPLRFSDWLKAAASLLLTRCGGLALDGRFGKVREGQVAAGPGFDEQPGVQVRAVAYPRVDPEGPAQVDEDGHARGVDRDLFGSS